jgi:hypothetical protein
MLVLHDVANLEKKHSLYASSGSIARLGRIHTGRDITCANGCSCAAVFHHAKTASWD